MRTGDSSFRFCGYAACLCRMARSSAGVPDSHALVEWRDGRFSFGMMPFSRPADFTFLSF